MAEGEPRKGETPRLIVRRVLGITLMAATVATLAGVQPHEPDNKGHLLTLPPIPAPQEAGLGLVPPTTASVPEPTSNPPRVVRDEPSRSYRRPVTPTVTQPRLVAPPSTMSDAFWKSLSNCENPSGDAYGGFFQFTDPGTAKKAGYVAGSSYEDQLAAAKRWANIIHPREGTTAGWPHCWWVALRSVS